jgi:uncharacterized protein with beta-barrel porin domain
MKVLIRISRGLFKWMVATAVLFLSAESGIAQYSVNVTYEAPGVLNSTVGGGQVYTFNAPIPLGLNSSLNWTNVGTFANAGITAANQYGGADGTQYLTAKPTTLLLNTNVSYFGLWWSAGSAGNTLTFKSGTNVVATFTTSLLTSVLSTNYNGMPVMATNGPNQTPGVNSKEKYAFINFYAASNSTFNSIVASGGGFESDNWTVATNYSGSSGTAFGNYTTTNGSSTFNGNVTNSGTLELAPTNGPLAISGNVTEASNSTTVIVVNDSNSYGQMDVNGKVLQEGTLEVVGNLEFGDQLNIINASNGVSGDFTNVVTPDGFRAREETNPAGTSETVIIAPESYTQVAQNQNETNVAKALDTFIPATSGDKEVVSTALDKLTAPEYQVAFPVISPSMYQSLATIAFNAINAQYNDLVQQMFGLRAARTGFSMNGFPENTPVYQEVDGKNPVSSKNPVGKNPAKDILAPGSDRRWGMFVDGNGIFAQANSANMLPGYNAQSGGLVAGLSYQWSPSLLTGLYCGYEGSYSKINGIYNGSTVIDNAVRFGLFGTYGTADGKGFYADGLIGGSYNNYNVTRNITFQGLSRTANSTPGAGELDSLVAAGYNWRKGNWAFGPFSSLQYSYYRMNSFNETGAQSLDYQGLNWNSSSMIFNLGGNCAYSWQASRDLMVVPQMNLSWQHEFMQNPYAIEGSLGGVTVAYNTAAPLRDWLYTGVGVNLEYRKRWTTSFFYNAAAGNKDLVSQNIFWSAGVRF